MGAVRFLAVVMRGSAGGDGVKGQPTVFGAHGMRPRLQMHIRVIAETPFNDLGMAAGTVGRMSCAPTAC
jgi:hypothetical protein